MTALQLSLLILTLIAIAAVGFVSYKRNEAPRERKAPRVDGDEEQLDLLGSGSAAGRFDEFGVSEPRRAGTAREEPAIPPAPEADPGTQAPPAAEPRPASKEECIVSLFVLQREGEAIAGETIHRQLHALGLEPGERLTYERRVGGQTWFHVANMRKPGHLDPGEADRFETPGLSLFALLDTADDPVATFDDLLSTASRLAESLDAVVLDDQRRPLEADGAERLRAEVLDWHNRQA